MASTAYERGRAFEYRVKAYFEKLGYVVQRSPKSKSAADLWVVGHSLVMFVQCKVGGYIDPAERHALWDMCMKCCAVPVMARREGRKLLCYQMLEPAGRPAAIFIGFTPEPNEQRETQLAA